MPAQVILFVLLRSGSFDVSICKYSILLIWAASSEVGTYRLCEQRRFRRACPSAQSRQNLCCSLTQAVSQEEPSDRKPDPWPLWMAGHAQLKFVMTECSKTQIRLTRPIYLSHLIDFESFLYSPANVALCAWNSRPPTHNVTSLNSDLSNKLPMSSLSRHSGTFTGVQFDWPETLTVSPTTLTLKKRIEPVMRKPVSGGLRPAKTQTGLLSYWGWLEFWNSAYIASKGIILSR